MTAPIPTDTWRRHVRRAGATGLVVCLAAPAAAQQDTTRTPADSLRAHRLSEITISAPAAVQPIVPFTALRVEPRTLRLRDPLSVADAARLIPAAHVQTNSRGETLVYLRDAGERQVSVFLDGALLNVPWDNRADLSLVPASVIDGITVAKGVPPIEYGTNVVGGAVNLTTRVPSTAARTRLAARAGSAGRREGTATHSGTVGRVGYEVALGHATIDGWPLPDGAALAFHQPDSDLRTNTDARITNAFLRAVMDAGPVSQIGVTLLVVDGEKGVAPEGHLDPAVARVRFWRYPRWRTAMAIVSGEGMLDGGTLWKASAWVTDFSQHIMQFASADYAVAEEREDGDDLTIGTRAVFRHAAGPGALKLAVNALTSAHDQRTVALAPDGRPAPGGAVAALTFRQHLVSGGLEYELHGGRRFTLTAGVGVDAMFAPETGDKPAVDPFVDYSATLGARHELGGGWFVRGAAGRKTRFPTMRELFGEGLDRFLINPDLEPESALLAELALGWRGARLSGEIIPFVTRTENTIDQRNVLVAGETRPRRQRVNLEGSSVVGVELVAAARPVPALALDAHLTLMRPRRRGAAAAEPVFLAEKPEALGRIAVHYTPAWGLRVALDGEYTGRAYSLDEDNAFVPLPTAFVMNVRVGQRVSLGAARVEVYGRSDNLTDEVVVPQLGLPGPGRSFAGGVEVDF